MPAPPSAADGLTDCFDPDCAGPACVSTCDPRTQTCADGEACYFDAVVGKASCAAEGNQVEGAACSGEADCVKGLHCRHPAGQAGGQCRLYCDVAEGAAGCPQAGDAQDCVQLPGADPGGGACAATE